MHKHDSTIAPKNSRRSFLKFIPCAAIAAAIPTAAAANSKPRRPTLEEALARMSAEDRADYHASQLAKALKEATPNAVAWHYFVDFKAGVACAHTDRVRAV